MADEQTIGADDVARKQFATAFRGFDQHEVRAYLGQVAAELASLHERERALRERVLAAETVKPPRQVDEEELEAVLGVETTRVLHAAREAAAEIRARAEESVARLLREANDDAVRMRSDAETVLARRTEEAEAVAAAIVARAEEEAAARLSDADTSAAATVEDARQQGREMLAEAQAVRERVLKDLSRRRKAASSQLEQLLAGRDRLLQAYDVVRGTLDAATGELLGVEAEARLAADVAGLRPPRDDGESDDRGAAAAAEPVEPVEPAAEDRDGAGATPEVADAPEPEPEPEPEPVAAEAEVAEPPEPPAESGRAAASLDDRRSSSLRLLRRKPDAPEMPPLADDVEGVRIIRPEPDAAPPVPRPVAVPDLPAPPEPAAADGAEPEPEPEGEPESDAAAADVAEAEADDGASSEPTVAGADPAPAAVEASGPAEPSDQDAAAEEHPAEETPVDDLFARLRADRAAAVATAEAVLAATPAADTADTADTAESVEPTDADDTEAADDAADDAATVADTVFETRDAAVEPFERALTRAMKRALADEQNEVLDALRRLRGAPRLELLLPDPDAHVARFADASVEHLRAGATAGAGEGPVPDVDELAASLGSEITDDLRSRLERALDATSGDEEALIEAISAMYREWKSSRSEPFARHHVAAAYALGAFVVTAADDLRWVVDTAEGGCPDCDDNALAGPTRKGQAFPTGQVHPPAHAGCRCLVLPAS